MPMDRKMIQKIGRTLQSYDVTPRRAAELGAELDSMAALLNSQRHNLSFESEPAQFTAVQSQAALAKASAAR